MSYFKNLKIFAIVLFICIIATPALCEIKQEEEKRVIKFGYVPTREFSIKSNGKLSGYEVEYLYAIAQYTEWDYEFIELKSREEGIEKLLNNEIDLIGGIEKHHKTNQIILSKSNYAVNKSCLIVKTDDIRYSYDNFDSFNNMKVGVLNPNNSQKTSFKKYAKDNNFTIKIKNYPTREKILEALDKGNINAGLISGLNKISNKYRIVALSGSMPVYFATLSSNKHLAKALNDAIQSINENDPYFNINLYTKYYTSEMIKPTFTDEEEKYIRRKKEHIVIYDPDLPPIEYLDRKTKKFAGYSAKLLKKISEKSGLRFKFIPSHTVQDDEDYLLKEPFDIYAAFSYDFSWAEKHKVRLTRPYITKVPAVIISLDSDKIRAKNNKIALIKGYFYPNKIRNRLKNLKPVYYRTTGQCLDAVMSGKTAYAGASFYDAEYYLSTEKYKPLVYRNITELYYEYGIGVSRATDKRLFSIISKTLNSFTAEDKMEILRPDTLETKPNGWKDIAVKKHYTMIRIVFFLSLMPVAFMLFGFIKYKEKLQILLRYKKLKFKKQKDSHNIKK
ncbi:MAG: transporter substrate-binding domain-containing protein [Synergistaceae bacterium]